MRSASPTAVLLLLLNLFLYFVVVIIASWAVNRAINRSFQQASQLTPAAKIFPIYFPMAIENMATGFFVIVSLIAGVFGVATSLVGVNNMRARVQGREPDLYTVSASALACWALTVLALGFASKEILLGYCGSSLRIMEAVIIVLSVTQLLCTVAIYKGTIY